MAGSSRPERARRRSSLNACVAFGLLQRFDEADGPSLYHPPGLLRPWLSDPERLSEQDGRAIDRRSRRVLACRVEADREAELRVPIDVELAACRVHARRGEDLPNFRWATVRLGRRLEDRAEWLAARALLYEIPDDDQDADSLRLLRGGRLAGRVEDGPEPSSSGLTIARGRPTGEAATWHELATIDLGEGDYHGGGRSSRGHLQSSRPSATAPARRPPGTSSRRSTTKGITTRRRGRSTWGPPDQAGNRGPPGEATTGTSSPRSTSTRVTTRGAGEVRAAARDQAGHRRPRRRGGDLAPARHDRPRTGQGHGGPEKFARRSRSSRPSATAPARRPPGTSSPRSTSTRASTGAAREKFARSLAIRQAIGDRAEVAAVLAKLAIDGFQTRATTRRRGRSTSAVAPDQAGHRRPRRRGGDLAPARLDRPQEGDLRGGAGEVRPIARDQCRPSATAPARRPPGTSSPRSTSARGTTRRAREKFARSLEIQQAIGDRAGEAATWHQLAKIDVKEDKCLAAREKFARLLEIYQAIGDRTAEADTWHQLATIDSTRASTPAAQGEIRAVARDRQAIGDREGEASTFSQLVRHCLRAGSTATTGLRLISDLRFSSIRAIGHGDAQTRHSVLSPAFPKSLGLRAEPVRCELEEAVGSTARSGPRR